MPAPAPHTAHVLHESPIITRTIRKGDIISFLYDGKERWVLVLQPNWKGMLHGLIIDALTRTLLVRIASQSFSSPPHIFYRTYLSQNKIIRDTNSYRTFDARKISGVKRILYDYGFNGANPNTMLMFGGLSIILGYDQAGVYADLYEPLNGFVKDRSKKGLFIYEGPTIPIQVLSYCKKAGTQLNFRTWKINRLEDQTDEQYKSQQENYLQKLLISGGVFFVTDDQFKIFREIIND